MLTTVVRFGRTVASGTRSRISTSGKKKQHTNKLFSGFLFVARLGFFLSKEDEIKEQVFPPGQFGHRNIFGRHLCVRIEMSAPTIER